VIHTRSRKPHFLTIAENGCHVLPADSRVEKGGSGNGFRPHELLEAALASCMDITIRMAANKYAIPLESVTTMVAVKRENRQVEYEYSIQLDGEMDDKQQAKLLASAERCPVRQTLSKNPSFRYLSD